MNIGYQLVASLKKGEGIFATKVFTENDIVMIGIIENDNVKKNHVHASQMSESRYVLHGGLTSKVNHSCNPNCGIRLNAARAYDFVAMGIIEIGDEITIDYAMKSYSITPLPTKCCCGAKNCRGSITGWKGLPASDKSNYASFVAPYLLQMDRNKVLWGG